MNKKEKYTINGAIIVALVNALWNVIHQLNEQKENPGQVFDWKRLFVAAGKGALVGGVAGFATGAYVDYRNSEVKKVNTDVRLRNFADDIALDKNSPEYLALSQKADELSWLLKSEFGSKVQDVCRHGSTQNGTALNSHYDIDLGANFKYNSFRTIKEMSNAVFDLFERSVGSHSIVHVRRQKKSIGVFVIVAGIEHKIDVAPLKLTKNGKGAGFLHVKDRSIFGKSSRKKTNIKALNNVKLSVTKQRIVLVLKQWRDKNDLPMSSHLIQNLVLDAYGFAPSIPNGFTHKVLMVLRHIANNLDVAVIRGVENTNNIITNIPTEDKDKIISSAKDVIENYEYQSNSILKEFFS